MDLDLISPMRSSRFVPRHCPLDPCPSRHGEAPFLWRRKGKYARACDRRIVQRFICLACRRYFSTQTFRLDYRLHRPTIHLQLFDAFVSKTTQRQSARNLECTRKTVVHRLRLLSKHSRDYHHQVLVRARKRGGLRGDFQLDELETFEGSRRLAPVTVPVLMELHTYFVLDLQVAPLPCRGKLSRKDIERKLERERHEGKRRSGSSAAVARSFQVLADARDPSWTLLVSFDHKSTYPAILRQVMPSNCCYVQHSSTARRDHGNPLFPINHTLAMLRDGLSRLVRRSWGASKQREWLERHAWIWIAYRNYIRAITNKAPLTSAAAAFGVVARRFRKKSFFEWRVFSTP
jgi:hypothetical protein